MPANFQNLYGVREVLKRDLDGLRGIRSKDKDRVSIITGYEGTGKSNLVLWMFEEWLKLLEIPIAAKHIKYIGDNKKTFIEALAKSPRFGMVVHDEAGKDLYARKGMSSFNTDLNIAYQVIRGRNIHTVLVIPSILDLDSFFRKRRVTQMFHVYKTGKLAYFTKKRLRMLVPKMAMMAKYNDDPDPMRSNISPLFTDTFRKYEGELLQPYLNRKSDNMQGVVDELFEKYVYEKDKKLDLPMHKQPDFQKQVVELRKQGLKWKEVAEKVDSNVVTVRKASLHINKSFNG